MDADLVRLGLAALLASFLAVRADGAIVEDSLQLGGSVSPQTRSALSPASRLNQLDAWLAAVEEHRPAKVKARLGYQAAP